MQEVPKALTPPSWCWATYGDAGRDVDYAVSGHSTAAVNLLQPNRIQIEPRIVGPNPKIWSLSPEIPPETILQASA